MRTISTVMLHRSNAVRLWERLGAVLVSCVAEVCRAETKALIGGGGGAYSYIRVLPDELLLKSTVMTTDFKRNSSGRT